MTIKYLIMRTLIYPVLTSLGLTQKHALDEKQGEFNPLTNGVNLSTMVTTRLPKPQSSSMEKVDR
jgi:hypothetical protein